MNTVIYNALRKALEAAEDLVADATQFPDEFAPGQLEDAQKEVVELNKALDQLVSSV